MSMYSLLNKHPKPKAGQVEGAFDGNICRCTGYRSILDAMQSFASADCSAVPKQSTLSQKQKQKQPVRFESKDGTSWFSPTTLAGLLQEISKAGSGNYSLVAGHTGIAGVAKYYEKNEKYNAPLLTPPVVLDVQHVAELTALTASAATGIDIGAAVPLADLIGYLQSNQALSPATFPAIASHLMKVANHQVRHVG